MQHARYYAPTKTKSTSNLPNGNENPASPKVSNVMGSNHATLAVGSKSSSPSAASTSNLMSRNIGSTITIGRKKNIKQNRLNSFAGTPNKSADSNADVAPTPAVNSNDPIQLTVWFHELRSSNEDVVLDLSISPGIKQGKVYELVSLEPQQKRTKKLYFVATDGSFKDSNKQEEHSEVPNSNKKAQISLLSNPLQKLLDIPPRSSAEIKRVTDLSEIEAETVEVFIKDVNISRAAMWMFSAAMVGTCGYKDKRLSYLGNRSGIIKHMYRGGKEIFSGYIGEDTKVIFRSESAKLTVLVQLSREMWHFEENGEIMFHKLVNNLFPKIFKRWRANNTHHSITIVLFTSVDLTDIPWMTLNHGERPPNTRDYFRVVVDQVNILSWDRIMANLRLEFANFKRDIMLKSGGNANQYYMEGDILPAVKGNMLEALNLGLSLVQNKFRNTDLKHSLNHFILITSGTGIFDVDYHLLLESSKKMASIDCSLDVISLSQPPLHIVPLFRYMDHEGKVKHCVPYWCDISFYKDKSNTFSSQWIPRCKIYELQMMGVMENESNDIRIDRLKMKKTDKLTDAMDMYDNDVFSAVNEKDDYFRNADIEKYQMTSKSSDSLATKNNDTKLPRNIKDSNATLSLIFSNRTTLTPQISNEEGTIRPKPSSDTLTVNSLPTAEKSHATSGVTTTKSEISAVGTVTQAAGTDTSALSSLYVLNKTSDDKKVLSSNQSLKSKKSTTSSLRAVSPPKGATKEPVSQRPPQHPTLKKKVANSTIKEDTVTTKSNRETKDPNFKKYSRKNDVLRSRMKPSDTFADSQNMKRPHKRSSGATNLEEEPILETDRFWKEITNPSKEIHSKVVTSLSRWSDVFPKNLRRKLIKWKSFESPAALPSTTPVFPTTKQLDSEYTFQIYNVLLNYENYLELETTHELMREMIQLRLLAGFQICYGSKVKKVEAERKLGGNVDSLIKYFPKNSSYGITIYMSFNDEIHRISCDFGGNLNVQLHRRTTGKTTNKEPGSELSRFATPHSNRNNYIHLGKNTDHLKPYFPLIRTRYADDYSPAKLDAINLKSPEVNWNQFDQYLAGFEDTMPAARKEFYHMKFVIMPSEIPKNAYYITNENLSDEEIRVEGLRKLIGLIEKGKYDKNDKRKETPMSEIIFYTGNLYDFLNEEAENYDITGNQPTLMIPENMRFNKSIKIADLAHELQGEAGLKLVDRTWHFKRHLHCFLGSELVTWLLECFEDIETREEATAFGQNLMNKGLFKHVESRHGLLDGYYFYEIEEEYVDESYKEKTRSWFGKKKEKTDNTGNHATQPSTPILTHNNSDVESAISPNIKPQEPLDLSKIISNGILNNDSDGSSVSASTQSKSKRKKFILSKSVKINVDPLGKSFRPELVTVHYDRVHNPEHCYHIRLQWLNTTTRFIDETISNWSRLCERHGLKLVETPWKELCTIPSINPFHSFVDLKLSLNPWLDPEFNDPSILRQTKFYYHLYLLKKSGFLLDNRSTVFFSKGHIEISYSWGKPTFQYAQYIHETGSYFVELRDGGDFFLAPNNIHVTRLNTLLTSLPDNDTNAKTYHMDSQRVMLNFRATCQDEKVLREIFREAKEHWEDDDKTYMMPSTI